MKLQKLIITGFGPYAERQELDFENNLKDKNMFVITGNTGAGKTTIFDAINFALYGVASGSDRDGKSLRSDFADEKTPTEVKLYFSLRGKDYYVKRSPSYMRLKQRGEGKVESKASAELKISKDKTITGASDVTKEIESILSITSEQFKQLVMIPQGEFKRLLLAKNEEKEDIFRKIFGTEVFEKIQYDAKRQAINLEKKIYQVTRDRLNKIRSFVPGENHEHLIPLINADKPNVELLMKIFQEAIVRDKEEQETIDGKIKEVESNITELNNQKVHGELTNKNFDISDNNKKGLDKLTSLVEEFNNKKQQLEKGKRALSVKVFEDRYLEKKTQYEDINSKINTIEERIKKLQTNCEGAETAFKAEQLKEEEKNKLIKEKEENEKLKGKVSGYETSRQQVTALDAAVNSIKKNIKNIDETLVKNENSLEAISKELEVIDKAKEQKANVEIAKIDCKNVGIKLDNLSSFIVQWKENHKKHQTAKAEFEKIEEGYNTAKANYETLEDIFRKSQAGILAADLEQGNPCPVCGSTHHPSLAQLENKHITEQEVNKSKEQLESIRSIRDSKLNYLTEINSSLETLKSNSINPLMKELLVLEGPQTINSITAEVEKQKAINKTQLLELDNSISDLNKIVSSEESKKKQRDSINKLNEDLRKDLQSKNSKLAEGEGKLSAARTTLEIIEKEFKGEIKTLKELEAVIDALDKGIYSLKKAFEAAEKYFNDCRSLLDKEKGSYDATLIAKAKAEQELDNSLKIFNNKIEELGFADLSDYKANCLTESMISEIDESIKAFNLRLEKANGLYQASLKEIEGKSRVDIEAILEKLGSEIEIKNQLSDKVKTIFSRISNNKAVLDACLKYNKQIEGDEKEYETVGKLSSIINGDNPKKINFERYVLAAYFEDIIEAANLRFNKMTSGRFELLRKVEMGDKRKGQGLDLEVFDNYTGKARDIKTLSGGESFKASLSMALGLADVVQAHAGGIQLDTMFIDEGFGTLDPESLDSAVECLMDLQNDGRLVGVISHVAELKERIQARLEVSSTDKGSRAVFRV